MSRSSFQPFARAVALLAALGMAACGPNPMTDATSETGGPDASDTPTPMDGNDVPMMMEGGPDVVADAPPATACNMVPVLNLNMTGTTMGATTRIMADNSMAMDSDTRGLQPGSGNTACPFRATHEIIYSYTLRTSAALRISTTNMGTSPRFDSVILVADGARMCSASTRPIACNDDDPLFGGDNRRLSSTTTTGVRMMGTTVLIAVGGFVSATGTRNIPNQTGMFELTVEELPPQGAGMPCDTRGINSICAMDATCVGNTTRFSTMGTCRANGSVPGARCATGDVCMGAGLMCDTTLTPTRCFQEVANGMDCERFTNGSRRCATGSSCVSLVRGSVVGTCAADGSIAGANCTTTGTCMGGLTCVPAAGGGPGTCLNTATAGGACSGWDSRCPMGQSCVASNFSGTAGTCTADGSAAGTACMAAGTCSGAGLMCTGMAPNQVCTETATMGMTCNPRIQCGTNFSCRLGPMGTMGTFDVYQGACVGDGIEGGRCRATAPNCDTGLTCSNAGDPVNGVCRRDLMAGAPCVYGITNCGMGLSCVHTAGMGPTVGTCAADGTVAGAGCRSTGMQCDAGLTCSNPSTGEGRCQAAAAAGAACDAQFSTNRCATGQVCRATALNAGMCAAPTMEMEPNDRVTTAPAVTMPAAIQGDLDAYDLDCVSVMVPANGNLFARASSPAGICPFAPDPFTLDWRIDVYDSMGRLLGGDAGSSGFGCPRIEGNDPAMRFPWARNMAAGTYRVCIHNADTNGRAYGTPAPYVLSVATN